MPGQQGYFTQPSTGLQFYPQGQQNGVQPQVVPAQTVVQTQPPIQPQPQFIPPQLQPQVQAQPAIPLAQRVATPFHPMNPMSPDSSESSSIDDESPVVPGMPGVNQQHTPAPANPLPRPPHVSIQGWPTPLPPPAQNIYGSTSAGPHSLSRSNPLPPPPRDLYELVEPYRTLTRELQKEFPDISAFPMSSEQLNEGEGPRLGHQRSRSEGGGGLFGSWGRSKSKSQKPKTTKRGGLFRSFSSAGRSGEPAAGPSRARQQRPEIPRSLMALLNGGPDVDPAVTGTDAEVYFMANPTQPPATALSNPMPALATSPRHATAAAAPSGTPGPDPALSPMTLFRSPGPARTPLMPTSAQPTPGPYNAPLGSMPFNPNMPQPAPEPPITFSSQDSLEFAGFWLTSPHRINFRGVLWPTAYHLLEAMRFMRDDGETGPLQDLQERVRTCQSITEVQAFVTGGTQWQRPDWEAVVLSKVRYAHYI
jgi:hypothetical protein